MKNIQVDEKQLQELKNKILQKEKENLKTKELSNSGMISWIEKEIEEVVCYLDQLN